MDEKCPLCKKNDTVVKVSSIIAASTIRTDESGLNLSPSFQGGKFSLSPSFQNTETIRNSELGKTLALDEASALSRLGGFALICVAFFFLYFLVFAPGTLYDDGNIWWLVVLVYAVTLLFLVCGFTLLFQGTSEKEKQAKATWNQLYYCFRHDIVYHPNNPKDYRPRLQMRELLNKKP
jgi:hypothetical protein